MKALDRAGVISSIFYGPDQRTQIARGTRNILFWRVRAAGIDASSVQVHFEKMRDAGHLP